MYLYDGYPCDNIFEYQTARRLSKREIILHDDIENGTVGEVYDDLQQMLYDSTNAPIHVYIKSPGGSVFDGLHLYDELKSLPCPVYTYGQGIIASAASFIFMAGEKRFLQPHAWFMIHEMSSFNWGSLSEQEDDLKQKKRMTEQILQIYADVSGLSATTIRKNSTRKNWWLDANEAVDKGFATQVGFDE
jgi:ATP-dependent Clp protease protease subunit